jgi:hypothetical protein
MDIEVVSYPAVCAGGLVLSSLEVKKHIDTFPIFFGFGLLFIGCPL